MDVAFATMNRKALLTCEGVRRESSSRRISDIAWSFKQVEKVICSFICQGIIFVYTYIA